MWQYMNAKVPSVFVTDIEEGVKRVQESNGKYAFLLESVYNDYYNNKKPCDTMKVGTPLNRNHYGIATRKYSPLRYMRCFTILRLLSCLWFVFNLENVFRSL